jgi:SPP1 gp7 family putative phage head morphogenesis protein
MVRPPVLDPVHPNAGLEARYRRKLAKLTADMHASVTYWTAAAYKANTPALALDASPAATLRELMRRLTRRWTRNFDRLAQEMAEHFATEVQDRTDGAMQAAMKRAGWTVKFRPTRAQNDVYQAVVGENVGLIKSIPQKHLAAVEGAVMRSVAQGRDLSDLSKELEGAYGVTKRRAAFIARDQNNKATAVFTRVRQDELGITEAIWMHSHGGKEPRPSHLANDGNRYNVKEGWFDPDEGKHIRPGELINCRCVSRSVIPGFG